MSSHSTSFYSYENFLIPIRFYCNSKHGITLDELTKVGSFFRGIAIEGAGVPHPQTFRLSGVPHPQTFRFSSNLQIINSASRHCITYKKRGKSSFSASLVRRKAPLLENWGCQHVSKPMNGRNKLMSQGIKSWELGTKEQAK